MISINEAAKILGIRRSSIYLSKKYQPYIRVIDGRKYIDLNAYLAAKNADEAAVVAAKNLIARLRNEYDISYAAIAREIGYPAQNIQQSRFSPRIARKIIETFGEEE